MSIPGCGLLLARPWHNCLAEQTASMHLSVLGFYVFGWSCVESGIGHGDPWAGPFHRTMEWIGLKGISKITLSPWDVPWFCMYGVTLLIWRLTDAEDTAVCEHTRGEGWPQVLQRQCCCDSRVLGCIVPTWQQTARFWIRDPTEMLSRAISLGAVRVHDAVLKCKVWNRHHCSNTCCVFALSVPKPSIISYFVSATWWESCCLPPAPLWLTSSKSGSGTWVLQMSTCFDTGCEFGLTRPKGTGCICEAKVAEKRIGDRMWIMKKELLPTAGWAGAEQ